MRDFVTAQAAKTGFFELLARVEAGEQIIIVRGKQPIAHLVPAAPKAKRSFGAMRGKISIGPEFFDKLADEELGGVGLITPGR